MSFCSYTLITGVAAPSFKKGDHVMLNNSSLIDKTVQITVAKMTNSSIPTCKDGGAAVADFMQEVYDKLVELNKNNCSN